MSTVIFKIVPVHLWRQSEAVGQFDGAPVDVADGFIHFSAAAQVRDTAERHFAGLDQLLLVAVSADALGDALFPHLYAPLRLEAVEWVKPLPLAPDGRHLFPALDDELTIEWELS